MEVRQNPTKPVSATESEENFVDLRHQALIDYKAMNGLIVDEEGNIKKMTMQELADICKVDRTTLYEWLKTIPNFWDKVNSRRREISPKSRLAAVHEIWFLKARKGEYQHMQLWLANFDPDFRMPMQKHQLDIGDGLAEVMKAARQRASSSPQDAIEGEVVDAPKSNA